MYCTVCTVFRWNNCQYYNTAFSNYFKRKEKIIQNFQWYKKLVIIQNYCSLYQNLFKTQTIVHHAHLFSSLRNFQCYKKCANCIKHLKRFSLIIQLALYEAFIFKNSTYSKSLTVAYYIFHMCTVQYSMSDWAKFFKTWFTIIFMQSVFFSLNTYLSRTYPKKRYCIRYILQCVLI